jgi:uncharacterized small protein (DUF1192 family)
MELKDLRREKILTDIISERDAMIDALIQEIEKLKAQLADKAKEGK